MANSRAFGKLTPQQIRTLLCQARGGSKEALGQLFTAFRPFLAVIADEKIDRALKRKGSQSDLVQQTFLEAQCGFEKFQGHSSDELAAWLRKILLYNLGDFCKRFQRTAKRNVGRERSIDDDDVQLLLSRLALGHEPSPGVLALRHEEFQRIVRAIDRLRPEYAQVLHWRYREHWTVEKIAEYLNRSVDAVRMLLKRARTKLQAELSRDKTDT
jgi:RNA polymerase sigma-70 factor, ECF subfamily